MYWRFITKGILRSVFGPAIDKERIDMEEMSPVLVAHSRWGSQYSGKKPLSFRPEILGPITFLLPMRSFGMVSIGQFDRDGSLEVELEIEFEDQSDDLGREEVL